MNPAFVVRLRPCGPWRIGPGSGARDRVDAVFHSDALYSALTAAMAQFGQREEWLAATAGNPAGPAVRLSSLFPYLEDVQFVPPPRNLWPPVPSARVRWRNAGFVPLPLVSALASESYQMNDRKWFVDGASGCLMPADGDDFRPGPFRVSTRAHAAVDRVSENAVEVHSAAALEFNGNAGLWAVVGFEDEEAGAKWSGPVKAAFRLLADSGMGGKRSLGWGRAADPLFAEGVLPDLILPPVTHPAPAPVEAAEGAEAPPPRPAPETGYWLLSLFHPAPEDPVDWHRGNYSIAERGGRIESPARSGGLKKLVRMVEEGSVVASAAPPRGNAPDVAPEGFPHPVYRWGCPIAIPIPLRQVNA